MRFPIIAEAERSAEQQAVADAIAGGPRGQLRGPFLPLLHSPGLAAQVQALGAYLRFDSALPKDLIEIAILMTARRHECGYIWQSHRRQALAAGVAPDVIAAIAGRAAPELAEEGATLIIAFCGELLADNQVSNAIFERAVAAWGRNGVLDLTGVVGYYGLLSMVLNVAAPRNGAAVFDVSGKPSAD